MATRTLTEYHMGIALNKMGLTITTRELRCGDAAITYTATQKKVGQAVRLPGGDWRVPIEPVKLGNEFSIMAI